jgi:hypothetical protein
MTPVPGLPTLSYTVPADANRINVIWGFECDSPTVVLGDDRLFATVTATPATAITPNEDAIACEGLDNSSVMIQRAFDVTPGAAVTITGRARVDSGTGGIDDSYMTVTAGSQ